MLSDQVQSSKQRLGRGGPGAGLPVGSGDGAGCRARVLG